MAWETMRRGGLTSQPLEGVGRQVIWKAVDTR